MFDSPLIPVASLKSLPERVVNLKGYVAEVMLTNNQNQGNYGSNYSHSTYFVKVVSSHELYHHSSPIDEIKIFVKVYPEKIDDFQKGVTLGSLIEFLHVKQYFSADLNYVFRVDFRPQNVIFCSESEMEPQSSFRKRLAILQSKEQVPPTILADLDARLVVRRCIKVTWHKAGDS